MKKLRSILIVCLLFTFNVQAQNNLDFYIQQAEQNSPLLQKQERNKNLIELDLKQFKAIYESPNVNLNGNVLFSPIVSVNGNTKQLELVSAGSIDYYGYDLGVTNGGQYQAMVSVSQPLFTRKYLDAQQNNANLLQEQNINVAQLTRAELKQTVTHQYILCLLSQKQKENIKQTIQVLEDQIQQMQALVKAGVYKLIDLKLLEIELQNNRVEEEQLSGNYRDNFDALKLLCGINDSSVNALEEINLSLNTPSQTNSLFISKFRLDSLSVKAAQENYNLKYLPQINAFGDAGLNATYLPGFNRLGFSVGLSLTWNLFDGHQQEINDEKTNIQLSNINTDLKYFKSQNDIRKRNLLSQIDNLDKQLILIDKQLSEYENLLELYKIEIKESLISVLELKTLIREISAKQQIKTNTLMSKEILINAYNYWNL